MDNLPYPDMPDITIRNVNAELMIGRGDELAHLKQLAAEVSAGVGGVLLVAGEQGVGKSALLREGLAEASVAGCRVGWAAADELGQGFPLQLMVDCLGVEGRLAVERTEPVGGTGTGRPVGMPEPGVGDLGPGLSGPVLPGGLVLPGDPVLAGAERLLSLVDRLCMVSPVVIVAEDLHWADEASLLVWQRLCRMVGQLPLLVAGSCRPASARTEVERLWRSAARVGVVVELGPLGAGEVAEVAAGLLGARPGPRLTGLLGRAGGNPLYVRELVDGLVRDGQVHVEDGAAELVGDPEAVPVSLVAAIGERLAGLSAQAAGVLRWAAVLGQEFSVTDLGAVTGLQAGELLEVVEQAVAAGVLVVAGSKLAFRHELVRQVLYEGIPAGLRHGLHAQAAKALAAAAPAQQVAAQLIAAPETAGTWILQWLADAIPALMYRAPQVSAELLRRVLGQLPEDHPQREMLEASLVTVASLLMADKEVEWAARPLLARTTDPERAAEVAMRLGSTLARVGRTGEAASVVAEALARPGTSRAGAARLRALEATTQVAAGQWDQAAQTAGKALAAGKRAGDPYATGYALHVLSVVDYQRHDLTAALAHMNQALKVVGEAPQTTDLRLMVLANRVGVLKDLDRHDEASAAMRQGLALAEQTGTPRLGQICCHAAGYYFGTGRWDDALTALELAGDLPGPDWQPVWVHGLAALICGHRDDLDTAREHLAAVQDQAIDSVRLRQTGHCLLAARALAAERDGQPDKAAAILAECLDPSAARDMQGRFLLLPALVRAALAARRLRHRGCGHPRRGARRKHRTATGQDRSRSPLPGPGR